MTKITAGQCEIDLRSTGSMTRQQMYLAPGQHEDLKCHIDCGLYLFFITIRLIMRGQADGISPEGVHQARPIIAWHLVTKRPLPSTSFWFGDNVDVTMSSAFLLDTGTLSGSDSADMVNFQQITPQLPLDADVIPTGLRSRLDANQRTRIFIPRNVKKELHPDPVIPMPLGRKIHWQDKQTYIANSTMSDHTLEIDAGLGLFASRPFKSDSTIKKNDDIITYYEGTVMSLEEVERVQSDPNYTRTTGFIIEFQGMAIEGYDHENDTYASPGVVINDFLDDRNNCYFSKDDSDSDSDGDEDYTYKRKSCTKGTARLRS